MMDDLDCRSTLSCFSCCCFANLLVFALKCMTLGYSIGYRMYWRGAVLPITKRSSDTMSTHNHGQHVSV